MMKRMTGLLLAALMLFALVPAVAFAESEPTEETRENGSSVTIVNCKTAVNVRKGPSSKTSKIGSAKKGSVFELLGVEANGKWYKIQYTEKTVGYVFHRYGKVTNTTPTARRGMIVNCKTQVNIREKASSKSKIIGTSCNGAIFDVLGVSGNWVKIDYDNGKAGYVYKTYIQIEDVLTGKTGTIVNCKTAVNIREKASSKSKILGTAKKGEKFDLIGKSGNWYKIDYNGKTAYVFHRYIKVS